MTLHTQAVAERPSVNLTLDEAKELLQRAVAEKGNDYVYASLAVRGTPGGSCVYFDPADGCPSCLIGHVLDYKGLTLAALAAQGLNETTSVEGLISAGVLVVDAETRVLLTTAQNMQDNDATWGVAVDTAIETYQAVLADEDYDEEDYDDEDVDCWGPS